MHQVTFAADTEPAGTGPAISAATAGALGGGVAGAVAAARPITWVVGEPTKGGLTINYPRNFGHLKLSKKSVIFLRFTRTYETILQMLEKSVFCEIVKLLSVFFV